MILQIGCERIRHQTEKLPIRTRMTRWFILRLFCLDPVIEFERIIEDKGFTIAGIENKGKTGDSEQANCMIAVIEMLVRGIDWNRINTALVPVEAQGRFTILMNQGVARPSDLCLHSIEIMN